MFEYATARLINQRGMLLIELMLAVALSLLISSYLVEMRITSQRSNHLQSALYQLQDTAKQAADVLRADIQAAGYIGCPRLSKNFHVLSYPPYSITAENKLIGSNETTLTILHASLSSVLLKKMLSNHLTLYVGKEANFTEGDILIISDCSQAEIFQADKVTTHQGQQKIVARQALRKNFYPDAEISRLEINTYFTAKTKHNNADGSAHYALFLENNRRYKTALVEGVRILTIRYSVASESNLVDLPASGIMDWSSVKGVAIEMEVAAQKIKKIRHVYVALR